MKILVLTGSPHKNGTSFHLANQFIKGALEGNHEVKRYDSAFLDIKGCLGCKYCRKHDDMCIRHDIMDEINNEVLNCDMVVFITPIFFFGMSSQLKTLIDRFYAILSKLQEQKKNSVQKKYMLFATCSDKESSTVSALLQYFKIFGDNYGWQDCGHILAQGFNKEYEIINSTYSKQAYEAGKNL